MTLKIICFEDNPKESRNLEASFKGKEKYKVDFRAYDLKEDWDENSKRAKEIAEFNPDLAIVDLFDQRGSGERRAGFRIVRKLKELQEKPDLKMNKFPVVVWSMLLKKTTEEGKRLIQQVEGIGAISVFKPRREKYNVAEILRKSGLSS